MRGQNCCMKCRAIPGACGRKWVCACHMEKKKEAPGSAAALRGLFAEAERQGSKA